MELISVEIELGDLLVRDLDALGVGAGIQFGMDIESGRGAGGRDQAHNDLKTNQRLATPVLGNTRKEAVFDLVPFAGARGEMADGDARYCDRYRKSRRGWLGRVPESGNREPAPFPDPLWGAVSCRCS